MKRVNIILVFVAVFGLIMTSCSDYKEKSVKLTSDLDSLNYAFGYVNGKIIKDYHLQKDTTGNGLKSLMKGIKDGLKQKEVAEEMKQAVDLGSMIGNQLRTNTNFYGDSTLTLDYQLLRQGLINGIAGTDSTGMSADQARDYFNGTMEAIQTKKMEAQYKDNKEA